LPQSVSAPSIGCYVVSLPGSPVRRRREAPMNLTRRLTETELPPPIRGSPNRANASTSIYNIKFWASLFLVFRMLVGQMPG
jgi:hypothetical protein